MQELIKLAKPIRDKYLLASCLGFTVESYELVYCCCQILKVGPGLVDRNQTKQMKIRLPLHVHSFSISSSLSDNFFFLSVNSVKKNNRWLQLVAYDMHKRQWCMWAEIRDNFLLKKQLVLQLTSDCVHENQSCSRVFSFSWLQQRVIQTLRVLPYFWIDLEIPLLRGGRMEALPSMQIIGRDLLKRTHQLHSLHEWCFSPRVAFGMVRGWEHVVPSLGVIRERGKSSEGDPGNWQPW